jgi:hypothetical protein
MAFREELDKEFAAETAFIENNKERSSELFGYPLLDQQLLTVYRLLKNDDRNFFLNYSDTGAGKTKAAIAVTYYSCAKHTLIICPCQVKDNAWKSSLEEIKCMPNKLISVDEVITECNDNVTYEILNYDKFNEGSRASKLIEKLIKSKTYDVVIFDEAHRLKNKGSNTYQNILRLTHAMRQINPNLMIIGATATPITTSNADLQAIYEIMSGKCADELMEGNLANRLINANKVLETSGFGYFPQSPMEVRYNGISGNDLFGKKSSVYKKAFFATHLCNIDGTSIEEDCIKYKDSVMMREKLHMYLKFNAYKHLIMKGTTIYTEYTYGDRFLYELKTLIENMGLTACIYSGENKNSGIFTTDKDGVVRELDSVEAFIAGEFDVFIGTKAMCEGVDGLQKVCNKLILHTIPTRWSAFKQLIGRFDRRGSNFVDEGVDVYVPMVMFTDKNGKPTGFDKRHWNYMDIRRIKDNITKGGHLEEISDAEKSKMVDEVINKLKNKYEMTEIKRKELEVNVDDLVILSTERKQSFINEFNARGKRTNPDNLHKTLTADPTEWHQYHKLRRESMKEWVEIPYEYIASKIKNKRHIVGDFGCGDNQMRNFIPENTVYGFDHVAIDDTVIACNMAHTPLKDESLDVAVFSLSISWGNTFHEEYVKEAYRLLSFDGLIYIAEPSKAYNDEEKKNLIKMLEKNGFGIIMHNDGRAYEDRGKFFYIIAIKR